MRVLLLEEEELGDNQVGELVVHLFAEEDDAILEQARIDIVCALTARALLDDHWDERRSRCGQHRRSPPGVPTYSRIGCAGVAAEPEAATARPRISVLARRRS